MLMMFVPLSLRGVPTVEEQPSTDLLHWRVLELSDDAQVLAGMLPEGPTLRVTSPIAAQDGSQITTASGRLYRLVGAPASDMEVLRAIAEHPHLEEVARDVTAQRWAVIQAAAKKPTGQVPPCGTQGGRG